MLVYVRRSDVTKDVTSTGPIARTPPCHVMTVVDELNERYHRKCEEYDTRLSAKPMIIGEILTYLTGKRLSWSVSFRFGNRSWIFIVHGKHHLLQRSGISLTLPPLPDRASGCRSEQAEFGEMARSQPNLSSATHRRGDRSSGRNIHLRCPL